MCVPFYLISSPPPLIFSGDIYWGHPEIQAPTTATTLDSHGNANAGNGKQAPTKRQQRKKVDVGDYGVEEWRDNGNVSSLVLLSTYHVTGVDE